MSKILKLVALQTYVGRATMGTIVKKKECCLFSDEVAEKLLESGRTNAEGEFIAYWTEQPSETAYHWDFSEVKLTAVPNKPKRLIEEVAGDDDEKETAPPQRRRTMRTRTAQATA